MLEKKQLALDATFLECVKRCVFCRTIIILILRICDVFVVCVCVVSDREQLLSLAGVCGVQGSSSGPMALEELGLIPRHRSGRDTTRGVQCAFSALRCDGQPRYDSDRLRLDGRQRGRTLHQRRRLPFLVGAALAIRSRRRELLDRRVVFVGRCRFRGFGFAFEAKAAGEQYFMDRIASIVSGKSLPQPSAAKPARVRLQDRLVFRVS